MERWLEVVFSFISPNCDIWRRKRRISLGINAMRNAYFHIFFELEQIGNSKFEMRNSKFGIRNSKFGCAGRETWTVCM